MLLTLDLSDDLAARLEPHREDLPKILELGLREVSATEQTGFAGITEVLETLAGLPTPEEILELRPAPALDTRIRALLAKNRDVGLTSEEEREWEHYEYLEHLVRLAKVTARAKLCHA